MENLRFNNTSELTIEEKMEISGGEWWCPFCWVDAVRDYFDK